MRVRLYIISNLLVCIPLLLLSQVQATKSIEGDGVNSATGIPHSTLLNINNISLWLRNDGAIGRLPSRFNVNPTQINDTTSVQSLKTPFDGLGMIYPRGTSGLLYIDNLLWIGKVFDDRPTILRLGGGSYAAGTTPGVIIEKGVAQPPEHARIYRYRKNFRTVDLRQETAEFFNKHISLVTPEMIEEVKAIYEKDLEEWPWQSGAPYKDLNDNGIMDENDYPGIEESDQVLWFAYNDLNESATQVFSKSLSIGLEMQVTMWAYKDIPELEDVIFKKYRLLYKGTASSPTGAFIDSMYFGQFVDPDIGSAGDDLAGCDSVLNLAFAYNTDHPDNFYSQYNVRTPSLGYVVLQGPTIASYENDYAIVDFQKRNGKRNLSMTSFFAAGPSSIPESTWPSPSQGDTYFYWNLLRGYVPYQGVVSNIQWINTDGKPTGYLLNGDPVRKTGWIDGLCGFISPFGNLSPCPHDRRMILNTGPFNFALGDTQELVIAIVVGSGADSRQSVSVVKHRTKQLKSIYPYLAEKANEPKPLPPVKEHFIPQQYSLRQNYPNPFNPETNIEYSLPIDTEARVIVYNILGQQVRVLEDGLKSAGEYQVSWDGRDTRGIQLPSGVYIVRLEARHVELKRRMVLVR